MRVGAYIRDLERRFVVAEVHCGNAAEHARRLVTEVTGASTAQIQMLWEEEIPSLWQAQLEPFVLRRLAGEPLQYLLGRAAFWKSEFVVGPGVLIPRPETERLIEVLLESECREEVVVAELGGGSGNIGISCLIERPEWHWNAFEINPASVTYLRQNCQRLLPPTTKYRLWEGDFFSHVTSLGILDWLVANPPYVTRDEISRLSKEVRTEPLLALDGGPDGLDVIRRLLDAAVVSLRPGGRIICEISPEQGAAIEQMVHERGQQLVLDKFYCDYAGLVRGFVATRKGA